MKHSTSRITLISPSQGGLVQNPRPDFRWRIRPDKREKHLGLLNRAKNESFQLEVVTLESKQRVETAFEKPARVLKVDQLKSQRYQLSREDKELRSGAGYAWRVSLIDATGTLLEQSDVAVFYALPANLPFTAADLLRCDGDILLGDFGNWEVAYGSALIHADANGCLDTKGVATLSGNQNRGHAISRLIDPSTPLKKGRRYKVALCVQTHGGTDLKGQYRIVAHNGPLPDIGVHPQPSSSIAIIGQTGAITSDPINNEKWTRIVLPSWRAGRDYERVAVMAMATGDKDVRCDISAICVREVEGCGDQIEATINDDGNVSLPEEWSEYVDDTTPATTVDVAYDAGSVSDIMGPLFDAAGNNAWYGEPDPCASIGGFVPEQALNLAEEFSTPDLGDGITPDDIEKASTVVSELLAKGFGISDLPPIGQEITQDCTEFEPDKALPFSGRDIIYVHGFRPDHVVGLMGRTDNNLKTLLDNFLSGVNDPALETRWPQDTAPFDTDGWYRTQGDGYWASHIDQHLGGIDEPSNRYLVVGYNSNQRLIDNVNAILHQIANAMSTGSGVVHNSKDPRGSRCFGRQAVIVSHSTGALVADVMMTIASWSNNVSFIQEAFGDAAYIPQRIDAHVSLHGAIGGSELASLAVVGANALSVATGAADVAVDVGIAIDGTGNPASLWLRNSLAAFGLSADGILAFMDSATDNLAALGSAAASVANRSILVDLMPVVAKGLWGVAINSTPVPVVTVAGAHPSNNSFAKLVLPGLDDGVVSTNSQSASPSLIQPNRYVYAPLADRIYDMGISIERAAPFFAEQFGPVSAAYGSVAPISSTGMLQPVLVSLVPVPRYQNHFTFLQCTSDHASTTTSTTAYAATGASANREETLVIERIEPLLSGLINPTITSLVNRTVRGQDLVITLTFSLPIFNFLPPGFTLITIEQEFVIPLWRRTYDLLPGGVQEDDHVYNFVLR